MLVADSVEKSVSTMLLAQRENDTLFQYGRQQIVLTLLQTIYAYFVVMASGGGAYQTCFKQG